MESWPRLYRIRSYHIVFLGWIWYKKETYDPKLLLVHSIICHLLFKFDVKICKNRHSFWRQQMQLYKCGRPGGHKNKSWNSSKNPKQIQLELTPVPASTGSVFALITKISFIFGPQNHFERAYDLNPSVHSSVCNAFFLSLMSQIFWNLATFAVFCTKKFSSEWIFLILFNMVFLGINLLARQSVTVRCDAMWRSAEWCGVL